MKKRIIKRLCCDANTGALRVCETSAEIYEYKGYQFGLCWEYDTFDNRIQAIELQTGYSVGYVCRTGTKSPKKDLLKRIEYLVDSNKIEPAISMAIKNTEHRRKNLEKRIRELEMERDCCAYPMNERFNFQSK